MHLIYKKGVKNISKSDGLYSLLDCRRVSYSQLSAVFIFPYCFSKKLLIRKLPLLGNYTCTNKSLLMCQVAYDKYYLIYNYHTPSCTQWHSRPNIINYFTFFTMLIFNACKHDIETSFISNYPIKLVHLKFIALEDVSLII